MLNLYDTEAVKAFIFDIMVENRELKQQIAGAQASSDMWYRDYQAQRDRADKAEAKVKELESAAEMIRSDRTDADPIDPYVYDGSMSTEDFLRLRETGKPDQKGGADQ